MPTVVKVGGSLFDWSGLPAALAKLVGEIDKPLLIAGGGLAANVVRQWDRDFGLGEERSHQLAVESLLLTARLLTVLCPRAVLVESRQAIHAQWRAGRVPVLHLPAYLAAEEPLAVEPLPHCWNCTSDAIAAWVAWHWPARLLFVKSTSPQAARDNDKLAGGHNKLAGEIVTDPGRSYEPYENHQQHQVRQGHQGHRGHRGHRGQPAAEPFVDAVCEAWLRRVPSAWIDLRTGCRGEFVDAGFRFDRQAGEPPLCSG